MLVGSNSHVILQIGVSSPKLWLKVLSSFWPENVWSCLHAKFAQLFKQTPWGQEHCEFQDSRQDCGIEHKLKHIEHHAEGAFWDVCAFSQVYIFHELCCRWPVEIIQTLLPTGWLLLHQQISLRFLHRPDWVLACLVSWSKEEINKAFFVYFWFIFWNSQKIMSHSQNSKQSKNSIFHSYFYHLLTSAFNFDRHCTLLVPLSQ